MNGAATPVSPGVSNRGTVSGLGVSPFMIGSGGPRMTSSVISGAVGGTLNRNVNSGTSINIPSFGGSRVNLGPNNASRGLGMQGPGRPMNSILQQASRQIVSLLGNTFSNSLGSVGQGQSLATGNGQLNSVGLMNDGVSSDVVPFDLNEFPQLSTHPSSAGSQGSLASLRKQGVNPFVQQNQDFSIQNEDFPALPGFKGGSNDFSTGLHQKDLQHERDLALMQSQHFGHRRFIAIAASKNRQERTSYSDQLLDYIEGGPKLRKWYGAPDQTRKDSGDSEFLENGIEGQQLTDEVRDAVLVTDADSMTGQLVMLSLIVKRARIRALVKDEKEMVQAFGSYVEPVVGDVADPNSLKKALRGVRAVFCSTKVGALSDKDVTRGIEHIVFLSQFAALGKAGVLSGLFNAKARQQAADDEAAVKGLGIPCTIIRSAKVQDEPGGQKGFEFKQGSAEKGVISREDVAMICVKALEYPPKQAITIQVANGDDFVDDWGALFESMNGDLDVQS